MHRFRDVLNELDLAHLRRVLGEREDPTFSKTRRRMQVNVLSTVDTFVDDAALAPLQALPQEVREQLISDVVWRLTCHVEGSTTRAKSKGHKLEGGFRMLLMVKGGRPMFVVRLSDRHPA